MASLPPDMTIKQLQDFTETVYGLPNNRDFDLESLHSNMERFAMRALKGIRKKSFEKIRINLIISISFFNAVVNQLHINAEHIIWKRFPYLCSYCGYCSCVCKTEKIQTRQKIKVDNSKKPVTLKEFQQMFEQIYPSYNRTLEDAGIHLAEELGELSEAIVKFRGTHKNEDFNKMVDEIADVFSCMMSLANSLNINIAEELSKIFYDDCHKCHNAPCTCPYDYIMDYES